MTACSPHKCHGHCPQNSPEDTAFLQLLGLLWTDKKILPLVILVFWPKALFSPLTQLSGCQVAGPLLTIKSTLRGRRGERSATSEGIQMIGTGALLSLVTKKGFEPWQPCWKKFWIWRNPSHFICLYWLYIYIYIYKVFFPDHHQTSLVIK